MIPLMKNSLSLNHVMLNSYVDKLREEKQLMYTDLLRMKNTIDEFFDAIARDYFSDDFYEED